MAGLPFRAADWDQTTLKTIPTSFQDCTDPSEILELYHPEVLLVDNCHDLVVGTQVNQPWLQAKNHIETLKGWSLQMDG